MTCPPHNSAKFITQRPTSPIKRCPKMKYFSLSLTYTLSLSLSQCLLAANCSCYNKCQRGKLCEWCGAGGWAVSQFQTHIDVLHCVAVCCCVLQCVAVRCGVLPCFLCEWCGAEGWAVCSVLRCVAVCCGVLRCVAVCCCVLWCVVVCYHVSCANGAEQEVGLLANFKHT